jgi:hypothetical protein
LEHQGQAEELEGAAPAAAGPSQQVSPDWQQQQRAGGSAAAAAAAEAVQGRYLAWAAAAPASPASRLQQLALRTPAGVRSGLEGAATRAAPAAAGTFLDAMPPLGSYTFSPTGTLGQGQQQRGGAAAAGTPSRPFSSTSDLISSLSSRYREASSLLQSHKKPAQRRAPGY